MTAILVIAGTVALGLLITEAHGWLPWLAQRLIERATRVLPSPFRERYEEEWLAELHHLPTRGMTSILFALRILARARNTKRALEPRYDSAALKRALDITTSSCLMLAISPLLCAVSLAVWIDSPGPPLIRVERGARNGRRFRAAQVPHLRH